MENLKISIIIPVYNTEKYIKRCLESVVSQTYKNVEIIIVNDGSKENENVIINSYMQRFSNIVLIQHEKNLGLYQARMTGVKKATGDYIAFLDSDDYLGIDYLRLLLKKAIETQADIVFGTTIITSVKGTKALNVLQNSCLDILPLIDEEIYAEFWKQQGTAFVWHTVWNKIYKKNLWDLCLDDLDKLQGHIVMTEDIAFSTVLFSKANKVERSETAYYYYCQNLESTTSTFDLEPKSFLKKISDISRVFNFVENYLKTDKKYLLDFHKLRNRYRRLWERNAESKEWMINNIDILNSVKKLGTKENVSMMTDSFFDTLLLPFTDELENLKAEIVYGNYDVISFDIFDTLITRPFKDPRDLFFLLDEEFEKYVDINTTFHRLRIAAEDGARNSFQGEDVTIDEIYKYMNKTFQISIDICEMMKKCELKLEKRYCKAKDFALELFSLAKECNKKVILISDMYINECDVISILKKEGFEGYHDIYLSSEYKKMKKSGLLYDAVLEDMSVDSNKILHIGDNEDADIKVAEEKGIKAYFLPSAQDLINEDTQNIFNMKKTYTVGNGIVLKQIADLYYKHFFNINYPVSFSKVDPYFWGYAYLGPVILAEILWLVKLVQKYNSKNLIFMARDGAVLFKAFTECKKYFECLKNVEIKYKYASRMSMLPIMATNKLDFYDLPIVYNQYSPNLLLKLLEFCMKENTENDIKDFNSLEINMDKKFVSVDEYHSFITFFLEYLYSEEKHIESKKLVKNYWNDIEDNDIIHDIGYSAAIHDAVVTVSEKNIIAAFIHTDKDKHLHFQRKENFIIESLYDEIPWISGLLREYIFSSTEGSCLGYKVKGEEIKPIFELGKQVYTDTFSLHLIQKAGIDFCTTFFGNTMDMYSILDLKLNELLNPFEKYLENPCRVDLKMFESSYFEDKLYGRVDCANVKSFWLQLINKNQGFFQRIDVYFDKNKKHRIAFWGTGRMCLDILREQKDDINIDLFIDNDKSKRGLNWQGIKIWHPLDIDDWNDIFIVIVCGMFGEIEEQLRDLGLIKYTDYISFVDLC